MRGLVCLLLLLTAFAGCRSGGRTQTDETSTGEVPKASEVAKASEGPKAGRIEPGAIQRMEVPSGWAPKGPYWSAYPSVFLQVVCDSMGNVVAADTLGSAATAAETDSALERVRGVRFDIRRSDGKVWWPAREAPSDRLIHFVVPIPTARDGTGATSLPVSRAELEAAGLGPWLAIWADLIPAWPFDAWRYQRTNDLRESRDSTVIDDKELLSRGMVSVSPDSVWKIHPFVYTDIRPDGSVGREPDDGFIVYRNVKGPQRYRKQVTGTPAVYFSADWVDSGRFVITGVHEVDVSLPGNVFLYNAPMLIVGDVKNTTVTTILGPPVPAWKTPISKRLDRYMRDRYRSAWKATLPHLPVGRAELEAAGLGAWLAIWDDLLPDRPIETWTFHPGARLVESLKYPPVEDGPFLKRGMVSTSPDGVWRLHPFLDIEFNEDGTSGKGVDAGYLLYRPGPGGRAWPKVLGSFTNLCSTDWLDSKRFVIAGVSGGTAVSGGRPVQTWFPFVALGDVDSMKVSSLTGPNVPAGARTEMWKRVEAYREARYPGFRGAGGPDE